MTTRTKRRPAMLAFVVTYDHASGPKRGWTHHYVRAYDRAEARRIAERDIPRGTTIRSIRREKVRR